MNSLIEDLVQQTTSTGVLPVTSELISKCIDGDACVGCLLCEGMNYVIAEEGDNGEDDEILCSEIRKGFGDGAASVVIETDEEDEVDPRDCVDTTSVNRRPIEDSLWNAAAQDGKELTFWEHRAPLMREMSLKKDAEEDQNSQCIMCFTKMHCVSCSVTKSSSKKPAFQLKQFAMATTVMNLGVTFEIYS